MVKRSMQDDPLSPVSMRAKVQKANKETRHILDLFRLNSDEIKQSSGLSDAAIIVAHSLDPSDPWRGLNNFQVLEKFENHAEALLSDQTFAECFTDWSGIKELKSFCRDRKWWKRRRIIQKRANSRIRPQHSIDAARLVSMQTESVDLPSDDIPVIACHSRTGRKGSSALRPKRIPSSTPKTPAKQTDPITLEVSDLSNDELEATCHVS